MDVNADDRLIPAVECPAPEPGFASMRVLALVALLIPCIACDQVTKALAVGQLKGSAAVSVVDGFFHLVYAENPGAFLGLGRALPEGLRVALLVVGVGLLLSAAAVVAVRKQQLPLPVFLGLALLVAGGFGNLVDRVARGGRVVDFAVLKLGPLQTGVFNVADVQIVAGGVLLALATWGRRKSDDATESACSA